MLPDKYRLTSSKEIKAALEQRQYTSATPLFRLVASDNAASQPRLAIVTPRKLGKAVRRNRMRRILRGAFLNICCKINKNIDCVLFPRALAAKSTSDLASAWLEKALLGLKLINNEAYS
ncbi:MAG: ribonuclease P protein component [Candidatus Saganbacteria bacterium]|nr:ribonuclease P protein component [Candidatus Saganbacteria bacterium]